MRAIFQTEIQFSIFANI